MLAALWRRKSKACRTINHEIDVRVWDESKEKERLLKVVAQQVPMETRRQDDVWELLRRRSSQHAASTEIEWEVATLVAV